MAFVAGLIAVEKTLPWRRVATYGTAILLLSLGVLFLAAPHATRCSHADCLMTVRARGVGVGGAPEPASWLSPQGRSHRRREGVRRSALHGSH
jgi:hypothetical protein